MEEQTAVHKTKIKICRGFLLLLEFCRSDVVLMKCYMLRNRIQIKFTELAFIIHFSFAVLQKAKQILMSFLLFLIFSHILMLFRPDLPLIFTYHLSTSFTPGNTNASHIWLHSSCFTCITCKCRKMNLQCLIAIRHIRWYCI